MNVLCLLLGHDFTLPRPTPQDMRFWRYGYPMRDGLRRHCMRCSRHERMTLDGRWVSIIKENKNR